jgi:hypothetical protein
MKRAGKVSGCTVFLQAQGIANSVVDCSSIAVNRRRRRVRRAGWDVGKLVSMLIRYVHGERDVWRMVHMPSVEVEAQRHLYQDLETLKQERAARLLAQPRPRRRVCQRVALGS